MKSDIIIVAQVFFIFLTYALAAVPGVIGFIRPKLGWIVINAVLAVASVTTASAINAHEGFMAHMSFSMFLLGFFSTISVIMSSLMLREAKKAADLED